MPDPGDHAFVMLGLDYFEGDGLSELRGHDVLVANDLVNAEVSCGKGSGVKVVAWNKIGQLKFIKCLMVNKILKRKYETAN